VVTEPGSDDGAVVIWVFQLCSSASCAELSVEPCALNVSEAVDSAVPHAGDRDHDQSDSDE
jgi:hypothetical protein